MNKDVEPHKRPRVGLSLLKQNRLLVLVGRKICSKCLKEKTLVDGFCRQEKALGGYQSQCKDCQKEHADNRHPDLANLTAKRSYNQELHDLASKGLKKCRVCEIVKPLGEFDPGADRSIGGVQNTCKLCAREQQRNRRNNMTPEQRREYNARKKKNRYRRQYNIDNVENDYPIFLAIQNYRCANCQRDIEDCKDKKDGRLHFDHLHGSRNIRGLLCSECNTALGLLDENPVRMYNAAVYILQTKSIFETIDLVNAETGLLPLWMWGEFYGFE